MAKPTSHPVVTRRVRTMVLILSVTEAKVGPGSSTGVADGLAGGDDFAVADLAAFLLGGNAGGVDALHAVGALLHHPARAHGDVGGAQQLQAGRLLVDVLQEVEAADFVGGVVR